MIQKGYRGAPEGFLGVSRGFHKLSGHGRGFRIFSLKGEGSSKTLQNDGLVEIQKMPMKPLNLPETALKSSWISLEMPRNAFDTP